MANFPTMSADSISKSTAQIKTYATPSTPLAPTNLTATPQAGPQVSLTWLDNTNNETGFFVERSTALDGPYSLVVTIPTPNGVTMGDVSFTDASLALQLRRRDELLDPFCSQRVAEVRVTELGRANALLLLLDAPPAFNASSKYSAISFLAGSPAGWSNLIKAETVRRVEPGATGLQVCQFIRNMDIGYRPFFGGSPGTCHFLPYQLFVGQNKLAGSQDGMGIHSATGMELVLPGGEVLRTGSMAHPQSPAWPHGPGPAMTYLPFIANAGYGIVSSMEFRLYATPQKTASLWGMFDSLDGLVEGIYYLMKYDYGTGITLMGKGCYVHCLYSSRHWQEGLHFIRATGTDTNLMDCFLFNA